ncbi:phosphotyrosyl phosphatase activator PTPA [Chloropicon primus]|uniref:Serine/threonine-protein phosphatase 2A activator n=2 Tax=Chloropicon primus TaxID=1764295 RepID=A0A5B8MJ37_9CHLO|nr:phosphotyrosyl phosphatase activator PTPA [Chloropicon primus]|eukprot:QDZ19362.1 phosphotyrosyl phosphatase activator PTPA [Chloropicon primus]
MMPPPPPRVPGGGPSVQTAAPWALSRMPAPVGAPRSATNTGLSTSEVETVDFDFGKSDGEGPAQEFALPQKRILRESDVQTFLRSQSCRDYLAFVKCLCSKIVGVKVTEVKQGGLSETLRGLNSILDAVSGYVDQVPPQKHTLRYGNPAFRDWHAMVSDNSEDLIGTILPERLKGAAPELAYYLSDSFGNRTRIDYGTGHETNFVILLYCLAKLGLVTEGDSQALVLSVFNTYLKLMRRVQQTYELEPAGSRGCWGLDDYQMLPFLFGAAQLVKHGLIKPKSIHNPDFVDMFSKDFMYFGCVEYVLSVKKGPISETSPMLNDISAVGRWQKVKNGMLKMYEGEVLSKFPITQHLGFGSIFQWKA